MEGEQAGTTVLCQRPLPELPAPITAEASDAATELCNFQVRLAPAARGEV